MHTLYEQPLNERMRTLLRLEHLFQQTNHAIQGTTPWDHRMAVASLVEVLALLERADLKTELLKELDRMVSALQKIKHQPEVDAQALQNILDELKAHQAHLQSSPGRLGDSLRRNELINTVRQRLVIPGGTCGFDLPQFSHWLTHPTGERQAYLNEWQATFAPLDALVQLLLTVVRGSAYEEKAVAHQGYFQKALDATTPCQLIRVKLHGHTEYPEISGGKHRISIRFLTLDTHLHPTPFEEDLNFSLACCLI